MSSSPIIPGEHVPLEWRVPQRVTGLAPLADTVLQLRSFGPLLLVVAFSPTVGLPTAITGFVLLLGFMYLRWSRRTWYVTPRGIRVDEGILSRQTREIPADRIQEVIFNQRFAHRILGIGELRIETAGSSGSAEIQLAFRAPEASALRSLLLSFAQDEHSSRQPPLSESGVSPGGPIGAPTPTMLVEFSPVRLFVGGMTGAKVLFSVIAAAWLLSLVGEFGFSDEANDAVGEGVRDVVDRGTTTVAVLAVVFVLGSIVLGGVVTVIREFGLRVSRSGERILVERGLLDRRFTSIALARVQAVEVRQNPIRRLFGLSTIRIQTAGGWSVGSEERAGATVLSVMRQSEVDLVLREIFPWASMPTQFEPLPLVALRRSLVRRTLIIGVVGALGLWFNAGRTLIPLVIVTTLVGVDAVARWRQAGDALTSRALFARSGGLGRELWVVPNGRIQSVRQTQSLLQRRADIESVVLDVAGLSLGVRLRDRRSERARLLARVPVSAHPG